MPQPLDRRETDLLTTLVDLPAMTRRIYQRGGYEGLEPNVLQLLLALHVDGGQTVGELVGRLALGQGTVSTALAMLRNAGLSADAPDPDDGRRRTQHATAEGHTVADRFMQATSDRLGDELRRWLNTTR